jgi:hypothetical protein
MTSASQAEILARADGAKVYDLSIDYFVGMPSFQAAGDPATRSIGVIDRGTRAVDECCHDRLGAAGREDERGHGADHGCG